jgi:hypothetical protein
VPKVPHETKTVRFLSLVTERNGLLASIPLNAVLDEEREVPEEWPTSASSGQLAAGVYRGDFT